ncbi:hypothetical protein [Bradyrhizobium sp. i1.12.3]
MRSFDPGDGIAGGMRVEPASVGTGLGAELGVLPPIADTREPARGEVLPFPVHGEALLVKLADVLRRHVAGRQPADNPLRLTISRCPWTRLSIDAAACVDYLSESETFQAAIEAGPDTWVILKTTDFDALASFVTQYVNDRLTNRVSMETAP